MNTNDLLSMYNVEKLDYMDYCTWDDAPFPTFKQWKADYLGTSDSTFVNLAACVGKENLSNLDFYDETLYQY